jgi:hypothetical protein
MTERSKEMDDWTIAATKTDGIEHDTPRVVKSSGNRPLVKTRKSAELFAEGMTRAAREEGIDSYYIAVPLYALRRT